MYRKLSVSRAVMRLYSFCEYDSQTHEIKITDAQEVLSSYFKVEPKLKEALKKLELNYTQREYILVLTVR